MQAGEDVGLSPQQLAQRANIKTPEVAARYLSKRRHHAKAAKLERVAKYARTV